MTVSIVIVTRNTREMVINCLRSLGEYARGGPHEVVVVDNASSDGTAEAIASDYPLVKLLREDRNTGFGRGSNDGVRLSSGDLLFFLNSDTLASPTAVAELAAAMEADLELGAVAPQLVHSDGRPQPTASVASTPATQILPWVRRRAQSQVQARVLRGEDLAGVGFLAGTALMVRRQTFEEVGGFDESLFFYSEDVDLCKRIADGGWSIRLAPQATVVHFGGGSTTHVLGVIEAARGRHQYLRKHYGAPKAFWADVAVFLRALRRAVLNAMGTVLTFGYYPEVRRKASVYSRLLLWFLLLMPGRESWVYRGLIGDWQGGGK